MEGGGRDSKDGAVFDVHDEELLKCDRFSALPAGMLRDEACLGGDLVDLALARVESEGAHHVAKLGDGHLAGDLPNVRGLLPLGAQLGVVKVVDHLLGGCNERSGQVSRGMGCNERSGKVRWRPREVEEDALT